MTPQLQKSDTGKTFPYSCLGGSLITSTWGARVLAAPGKGRKIKAEVIIHFAFYPVRGFF